MWQRIKTWWQGRKAAEDAPAVAPEPDPEPTVTVIPPRVQIGSGGWTIRPHDIDREGRRYFHCIGPAGERRSVWLPEAEVAGLSDAELASRVMAKVGSMA